MCLENIQHLVSRSRSKTWGADAWKKGSFFRAQPVSPPISETYFSPNPPTVVVCIVADGRAKINSRTLSTLATMGVYQDGVAKNVVAGKPVTAHIYEYTTQSESITQSKVQKTYRFDDDRLAGR